MAENSKIEWCDHTASPWYGCTKVAAGCDHCYAARMAPRNPAVLGVWGDDGVRVKSQSFCKNLRDWNKQAEAAGRPVKVFPSLCDPFEDRSELVEWRQEMFAVADECPWVILLLLTKRPENVRRMWPVYSYHACNTGDYPHSRQSECDAQNRHERDNVWIGCSIATQADADRNIPELLQCRDLAPVLFVSAEPLLGPVRLRPDLGLGWLCERCGGTGHQEAGCWTGNAYAAPAGPCDLCRSEGRAGNTLDWVIVGGESGPGARPMDPNWARQLRDQCQAAGVPFFMKQHGEFCAFCDIPQDWIREHGDRLDCLPSVVMGEHSLHRIGKKASGRLLDGVEWSQFPEVAQ